MNVRPQNCSIADVYITDELGHRAPTKTDYMQEKLALQELAAKMADSPEEILPRFVDLAMTMTGGVSAGLSLFESNPPPGVFRWRFLRGILAPFENATTPRDFSPCGITLDRNAPVLSLHPERAYSWISDANIVVPEVLLVPLYLGSKEPLGTLWIVSDKEKHFDSGHARAMTELATFVGIALRMLNTERNLKAALEQQEMLTNEMSHRIKNLFALTAGLVHASKKGAATPAEMAHILSGRLEALAEADALVRRKLTDGTASVRTDLAELFEKIMRPHAPAGRNFIAEGPAVALGERTTNALALVLHELATNAAKYGALSSDQGTVELTWSTADEQLLIDWTERGGPAVVQPPENAGFGTRLSRSTIVGQFGGELAYHWRPEGLSVAMSMPLSALAV
ncbi:MAG TPA: HWE histidine kinase domain-containing protein [Pseudolabrys sp.]|nr:HWE histidine kinase domain-containing protein [Pseudolabrys sp.]